MAAGPAMQYSEFIFGGRLDQDGMACDDGRRRSQRIFGRGSCSGRRGKIAEILAAGFAAARFVCALGEKWGGEFVSMLSEALCASDSFGAWADCGDERDVIYSRRGREVYFFTR
jgi:hypothetical protein